ncbi:MAG: VanZ family protein [Deltaproteobacteria bacterium]|nr:VanZ family protein [Deltaproteobacteria bacterium]
MHLSKTKNTEKSPPWGLWLVLYVSLMVATTPYTPAVWLYVSRRTGLNLTRFMAAVGIFLFLFLSYQVVRHHRFQAKKKLPLLVIVFSSYALLFVLPKLPMEQVHLFEYGLLSCLVYRVLSFHRSGVTRYLWGIGMVISIGMLDEVYQWLLPQRYGAWQDVFLNSASGVLGFGVAFLFDKDQPKLDKKLLESR